MISDTRMFNSINTNDSNGFDSITFGDSGKGKVKRLGKIVISNDLSISNVLLVEGLKFNFYLWLNYVILDLSAYME
jgi:hypothetical protein